MNTRGLKTRQEMQKPLEKLFMEKGFAAVTMTDICEATGLSRGGVYRHYASTAEAFLDFLTQDKEDAAQNLQKAIAQGIPACVLLEYYLNGQKEDVLTGKSALSKAVYEFGTLHPEHRNFLTQRYEAAVSMLCSLLEYGIKKGEFNPVEADVFARHLLIFWEGARVSSALHAYSGEMLEAQIKLIKEMAVK